ncbi:hypothetical protein RhoFW510R10_11770 [Rhodanobacter sp. FW510-R10]|nr:hypothetical protein RhoFW510R10_11770 [Rhodanobacter sp. FW510-R10]
MTDASLGRVGQIQTTFALLFHSRAHSNSLEVVTAHRVDTIKGAPVIGAGRPITPEDERKVQLLLLSRREDPAPMQVFPAHLLFCDATRLVWWQPSQVRPMYLRDTEGKPSVIVTRWPNLIFHVTDRSLSVATFDGEGRPDATTRLLHSTLPNIYQDTSVCTGNAMLPVGPAVEEMDRWEAVIFETAFTHSNNPTALRRGRAKEPMDVEAFWRARDGVVDAFPYRRAADTGVTLGAWIAEGGRA